MVNIITPSLAGEDVKILHKFNEACNDILVVLVGIEQAIFEVKVLILAFSFEAQKDVQVLEEVLEEFAEADIVLLKDLPDFALQFLYSLLLELFLFRSHPFLLLLLLYYLLGLCFSH